VPKFVNKYRNSSEKGPVVGDAIMLL